jgi:proteasome lid subunit RPN8/RPN11
VSEAIQLTSAVQRAIVHHARAVLPAEAVGLLGGPASHYATLSIPLPNCAGTNAFFADPLSQFSAERRLTQLRLQLVAIYHSHPGGGTQLSTLDLTFARRRTCFQIVIALQRHNSPTEKIQAYRVVDNTVAAVEVKLVGQ